MWICACGGFLGSAVRSVLPNWFICEVGLLSPGLMFVTLDALVGLRCACARGSVLGCSVESQALKQGWL